MGRKEQKKSNFLQGFSLLFLVINVLLLVAIMTPPHHLNPKTVVDVLEVETTADPSLTILPAEQLSYEWKLVDRFNDGEWMVEKYQEIEIHKNENGQVVKQMATANYNYLGYWRY